MLISGVYAIWYSYNLPPEPEIESAFITKKDQLYNWRTYRNTKYDYEFQYPNNWQVESTYSLKSLSETDNVYAFWEGEELSGGGVSIEVIADTSYYDKNEMIQAREKRILNGLEWNILNMKNDNPNFKYSKVAYTVFQNQLFRISSNAGEDYIPYNGQFENILSTFKFTSTSTLAYENSAYGISFLYPTDYVVEESNTRLFVTPAKDIESGMPPSIMITMQRIASTTETQKISYDENKDGVKFVKTTEIIDYDSNMAVDTYSFHPAPDKVVHFTLSSTAAPEIKGILNSVQSLNYRSSTKNTP